jgi:uracil DNA glycosylase
MPPSSPPPLFFFLLTAPVTCAPGGCGCTASFPFLYFCRNLTAWAEAGVLMLNTCLTVRARTAGSHQGKGWEQFTDRVIEVVDRYGGANLGAKSGFGRGVVFLAWGAWAAKRVTKLSKVS